MDDLELIKERINIVDLISEYLPLKKSGVNYKANCPFHSEKTPSFMVSPERGIWKCFGCDKGGDIFKFMMEKEGMDFKEALEFLAQKAGITLKRRRQPNKNERLFEINQKAAQFFHYILTESAVGKHALSYLKKRGLSNETIKIFNLGYAPQNWEALSSFLRKRGFKTEELIASGLAVPSKKECYDRFRGRIIFPLLSVRDQILGFSGRIVEQGEPKYINTPQTPIFDKGKFLFGLHLTKGVIREKKEAIVVEGEMDMILSFQSGVKNIVASKGTALTQDQVELLKKYADSVSLCFDTDFAGDAAARRGIELADRIGLNIKVIEIEGAKDPAELCLKDSALWEKCVAEAVPIYDYYLFSAAKRYDFKSAAGKRGLFSELLPIWQKISDPMTKEHYIQKLAALLQVKDDLVRTYLARVPRQIKTPLIKSGEPTSQGALENVGKKIVFDRGSLLEEYLLSLLLHLPPDHTYVPNFPETLFTREELRQIYVLLVLLLDGISFKGKSFKIAEFAKTLPEELVTLVDNLYLREIDEKLADKRLWQKEVETVVAELKKILIKRSLEKLSLQIKSAQEFNQFEQLEVLNKRFRDLSVKLKNL